MSFFPALHGLVAAIRKELNVDDGSYDWLVKDDGAVHYWKLDDTGSTAVDAVGSSDLTLTNSPTTNGPTLVLGEASSMSFDGVDQYLTRSETEFRSADNVGTIEAWVTPQAYGNRCVFSVCTGALGERLVFYASADTARIATYDATLGDDSLVATHNLGVGVTYHVAATSSGSAWKIYINGVEQTDNLNVVGTNGGYWLADIVTGSTDLVRIGQWRGANTEFNPFHGTIDEVAYYPTELTAQQILAHYVRGFVDTSSYHWLASGIKPVAYWRLGEAKGSTTAADDTGTYDLTYHNSPVLSLPSLVSNANDTSARFVAADSQGVYGDIPAPIKVQTISFVAWMRMAPESVVTSYLVYACPKGAGSFGKGAAIRVHTDGVANFLTGDGAGFDGLSGTADLRDNATHMLAVTYDGTTKRLYVDGVEVNSKSWTNQIDWTDSGTGPTTGQIYLAGARDNTVGVTPNIGHADGGVDEVAIYASTLTPEQILDLYVRGQGKTYTYDEQVRVDGAIHYWRLSDYQTGNTAADDFTGTDGDPPNVEKWLYFPTAGEINVTEISNNTLHLNQYYDGTSQATTVRARTKLSGDFDISVSISSFVVGGYGVAYIGVDGVGSVGFIEDAGGTRFRSGVGGTTHYPRTNDNGGLRITRVGSTITSYTKDGAGGWVQRQQTTGITTPAAPWMQLATAAGATSTNLDVYYDDFTVIADAQIAQYAYDEVATTHGWYTNSPVTETPSLLPAIVDDAVQFKSADEDYIRIYEISATHLEPEAGSYAFEFWFKANTLGITHGILGKGQRGAAEGGYTVVVGTDNLMQFILDDGTNQVIAKGGVVDYASHHWVCVIDRGDDTALIYRDGVLAASQDISSVGSIDTLTDNAAIGTYAFTTAYANWADGVLDEVAIYDHALSATAVQEHWDAGNGEATSYRDTVYLKGPSGYWRLGDAQEQYWDDVVLMMDFLGTNNDTTFVDYKGHAVTPTGQTKISNVQAKFGETSVYFDGSGDYLSIPTTTDFGFGTGSWTAECWIYPTNAQGSGTRSILDFRVTTGNGIIYLANTTGQLAYWDDSNNNTGGAVVPTVNQWNHIAVCYDGTTIYGYVNGTQVFANVRSLDFTSTRPLKIGMHQNGSTDPYLGYIDDLRITKGVCRYVESFALPVIPKGIGYAADETGVYDGTYIGLPTLGAGGLVPNDLANTAVILDTNQFVDLTPHGGIINGLTRVTVCAIITPLYSGETYETIYLATNANSGFGKFMFRVMLDNSLNVFWRDTQSGGSFNVGTLANIIVRGQTYHVAVVMDTVADTQTFYINGVVAGTGTTVSGTLYAEAPGYETIGGVPNTWGANDFKGTIDEVAVFPYALSATDILEIYEASSVVEEITYEALIKEDAPVAYWRLGETSGTVAADELFGNPGTYAGSPVLGAPSLIAYDQYNKSVALNGSATQYVSVPSAQLFNFANDFTLEQWVKTYDTIDQRGVYRYGSTEAEGYGILFRSFEQNAGVAHFLTWGLTTNANVFGTTRINDGNVHHVVAVRRGAVAELYVDGVLEGSGAVSETPFYNTGTLYFGSDYNQSWMLNGSIDEVALYDKALTATQINEHYTLGMVESAYEDYVKADAPVAYWKLDETPLASIDDDFTQTVERPLGYDPTKWLPYYSGPGTGVAQLEDNTLYVEADNTASNVYVHGVVGIHYIAAGDFDVQVDFSNLVFTGTGTRYLLLLLAFDQESTYSEAYVAAAKTAAQTNVWAASADGTEAQQARTGDSGKLRIVRTGTSISCQAWTGSWTVIDSGTGATGPAAIVLRAQGNNDGDSVVSANYDNFLVNSGSFFVNKAIDTIGGSTGTYFASPTQGLPGLVDERTAVQFNGTDQYVRKDTADFRSTDTQGAIEMWFMANDFSTGPYLWTSSDNTGTSYFFGINIAVDGEIVLFIREAGTNHRIIYTPTQIEVGRAYHLVLQSTGSAYEIYLNGVSQPIAVTTGSNDGAWFSAVTNTDVIGFGAFIRNTVTLHFNGTMDEVAVYDYPLSPERVAAHYARGLYTAEAYDSSVINLGAEHYWRLNEPFDYSKLKVNESFPQHITGSSFDPDEWYRDADYGAGGSGVVEIRNGKLYIYSPHKVNLTSQITMISQYVLAGDFDFEISLSDFDTTSTQANAWISVLGIASVGIREISGTKEFISNLGSTTGYARTNDTVKLRIKRAGTTVTTYRDDNVGSWTQMQSGTRSGDPAPIWIQCFDSSSGTTGYTECYFDNIIHTTAVATVRHDQRIRTFIGDDNSLPDTDLWSVYPFQSDTSSAVINGNKMLAVLPNEYTAATPVSARELAVEYAYTLYGDFQVTVDFSDMSHGTVTGSYAWIYFPGIAESITVYQNGSGTLLFTTSLNATQPARTNNYGKLRFTRTGTTGTAEYQDGSGSWTQIGTTATIGSDPTPVQLSVYTIWDRPSGVVSVKWDNFIVRARRTLRNKLQPTLGGIPGDMELVWRDQPGLVAGSNSGRFMRDLSSQAVLGNRTVSELDNLFHTGPVTLECWIRPTDVNAAGANSGRIISKDRNGSDANLAGGWALSHDGNDVSFYQRFSNGAETLTTAAWDGPASSLLPNEIGHIVLIYDGSSGDNDPTMYINGEEVTLTQTGTPTAGHTAQDDTNSDFIIGNLDQTDAHGDRFFDGWIDEVAIYPHALSAPKILENYLVGIGALEYDRKVYEGDPAFHWRLDAEGEVQQDLHGKHGAMTVGDPHWGSVLSLLDGGSVSTDSASGAFAWTGAGSIATSGTQKKWGSTSIFFNGTSQHLSRSDDVIHFDINQGQDFTVEAWVYLSAYPSAASWATIFSTFNDTSGYGWRFLIGDNGRIHLSATQESGASSKRVVATTTWTHVAYSRKDGIGQLFINGIGDSCDHASAAATDNTVAYIGTTNGTAWRFSGYMQDFRFTKGVCRYRGWFPVPSHEFGQNFLDSRVVWHKYPAFALNGTDQMIVAGNDYKGVGGSGCCIELLFRLPNAVTATEYFFQFGNALGANGEDFSCYTSTTGQILIGVNGGNRSTTKEFDDNEWHHLVVMVGATAADGQIWVDGVRVDTTTNGTGSTAVNIDVVDVNSTTLAVGGKYGTTSFLEMDVAQATLYSTNLTETEITARYRALLGDVWSVMLDDQPVGLWKLDETSATTMYDTMLTNDGTKGGGVSLNWPSIIPTEPASSRSVLIDGTSDTTSKIDLGFSTAYTDEFSFGLWVKFDAWPGRSSYLVSKSSYFATAATDFPFGISIGVTGSINVNFDQGNDFSYDVTLSANLSLHVPHHIVAVYKDSSHVELWVDGVLQDSAAIAWTIASGTRNWTLGAPGFGNGGGLNTAYLDNARMQGAALYDKALPGSSIVAQYEAGMGEQAYRNLVITLGATHYYRLGEIQGTTAYDLVGSENGTITGSPTLGQAGLIHEDSDSCMLFNGSTQYVAMSNPLFDSAATDTAVTISLVFTPAAIGNDDHLFYHGDNGEFIVRLDANNKIHCLFQSSSTTWYGANSAIPTIPGVTYHVVARWVKNDQISIFVNGRYTGGGAVPDLFMFDPGATYKPTIAANGTGSGNHFNGNVDEVAIFNKALTNAEIESLYLTGVRLGDRYVSQMQLSYPVAYYGLDEPTGTNADDPIGGLDGTYNATPTLAQITLPYGKPGTSVYFDGTSAGESVRLPDTGALDTISEEDFSIEAWIKVDDLPPGINPDFDAAYSICQQQGYHNGLYISTDASAVMGCWRTGPTYQETFSPVSTIIPGKIHHVVGTVSRSTGENKVYVDGELVGLTTFAAFTAIYANANPYTIGLADRASPGGNYAYPFKGRIDEVALYDRCLTANEVKRHFQAGSNTRDILTQDTNYREHVMSMAPAAHWFMGETSGTAVNDLMYTQVGTYGNSPKLGLAPLFGGTPRSRSVEFVKASSHYATIPNNAALQATNLSIAFWYQITDTTTNGELVTKGSASQYCWGVGYNTNGPSGRVWVQQWNLAGSNVRSFGADVDHTDGNIHHCVVLFSDYVAKIYIDGELRGTTLQHATTWVATSTSTIDIARRGDGSGYGYANARITEVSYFDRHLTDQEAKDLYNARELPPPVDESYHKRVIALYPTVYLPLNEASGAVGFNSGTVAGAVTISGMASYLNEGRVFNTETDEYTMAMEFNRATPSYLTIPDNAALEPLHGGITLAVWVKPTDFTAHHSVISKANGVSGNNGSYHLQILLDSGKLRFTFYNGTTQYYFDTDTAALEAGEWSHIAVTLLWNYQIGMKFYINGVAVAGSWNGGTPSDAQHFPVQNSSPFTVGARARESGTPDYGFHGLMQHAVMLPWPASPDQIARLASTE